MNIKNIIHEAIGYDTYTNFCKQCGISKFNFSKWINNHQELSVGTLFKILNYLEVLPPERNFNSVKKLTVLQLEDLYENRENLLSIFEALEKLENKNSLTCKKRKLSPERNVLR